LPLPNTTITKIFISLILGFQPAIPFFKPKA
jgi:hypothetical protein